MQGGEGKPRRGTWRKRSFVTRSMATHLCCIACRCPRSAVPAGSCLPAIAWRMHPTAPQIKMALAPEPRGGYKWTVPGVRGTVENPGWWEDAAAAPGDDPHHFEVGYRDALRRDVAVDMRLWRAGLRVEVGVGCQLHLVLLIGLHARQRRHQRQGMPAAPMHTDQKPAALVTVPQPVDSRMRLHRQILPTTGSSASCRGRGGRLQ